MFFTLTSPHHILHAAQTHQDPTSPHPTASCGHGHGQASLGGVLEDTSGVHARYLVALGRSSRGMYACMECRPSNSITLCYRQAGRQTTDRSDGGPKRKTWPIGQAGRTEFETCPALLYMTLRGCSISSCPEPRKMPTSLAPLERHVEARQVAIACTVLYCTVQCSAVRCYIPSFSSLGSGPSSIS